MNYLIIIIASLIPGILWVRFFYFRDKFEKEPIALLIKTFSFGALAVIPAALLEMPFRPFIQDGNLLTHVWVSFLVIGLGEELFKFSAFYFSAYKTSEFNEPVDGVIYGVTAAIGFSVVENMLYSTTFGLGILPIRAVIATLAHASFTGLLGYYAGIGKFSKNPTKEIMKGIVLAAFAHGMYDLILISQLVSPLLAILLIAFLYYILHQKIEALLLMSPFKKDFDE